MNQEQARELLELLRQINQAVERIEKLLTEEFGPARPDEYQGPFTCPENWKVSTSLHKLFEKATKVDGKLSVPVQGSFKVSWGPPIKVDD